MALDLMKHYNPPQGLTSYESGSFGLVMIWSRKPSVQYHPAHVAVKEVFRAVCFRMEGTDLVEENEETLLSLRHRNIVEIYEITRTQRGLPRIVMEACAGSLDNYLELHPCSVKDLRFMGNQILSGLGYLHQRMFVHRDVKPGNILVSSLDRTTIKSAGLVLKLTDFGACKQMNESVQTATTCGSPKYMAPEIFRAFRSGEETANYDGRRSDIFSAGATFYKMVMGETPFTNADRVKVMHDHDKALRECGVDDESFISLLSHMLSWNATERASAMQLLQHDFFRHGAVSLTGIKEDDDSAASDISDDNNGDGGNDHNDHCIGNSDSKGAEAVYECCYSDTSFDDALSYCLSGNIFNNIIAIKEDDDSAASDISDDNNGDGGNDHNDHCIGNSDSKGAEAVYECCYSDTSFDDALFYCCSGNIYNNIAMSSTMKHTKEQLTDVSKISLDDYKLYENLGSGTYGSVSSYKLKRKFPLFWKRNQSLPKIAVKTIQYKDINSMREMQLVLHLQNKNIVRFLGVEEQDDLIYIKMELAKCNLQQLKEHMKKELFTAPEVSYFAHQIVSGLSYLHAKSFVHRDVKPSNILAQWEGDAKSAPQLDAVTLKLCDFGLSRKVFDEGETMTVVGTRTYMAPQVARALDKGEHFREDYKKADVFSAGVVIYEMWQDKRPFSFSDLIREETVLLPVKDNGDQSLELTATLQKMMMWEIEDRCSAADAVGLFEKILGVKD